MGSLPVLSGSHPSMTSSSHLAQTHWLQTPWWSPPRLWILMSLRKRPSSHSKYSPIQQPPKWCLNASRRNPSIHQLQFSPFHPPRQQLSTCHRRDLSLKWLSSASCQDHSSQCILGEAPAGTGNWLPSTHLGSGYTSQENPWPIPGFTSTPTSPWGQAPVCTGRNIRTPHPTEKALGPGLLPTQPYF